MLVQCKFPIVFPSDVLKNARNSRTGSGNATGTEFALSCILPKFRFFPSGSIKCPKGTIYTPEGTAYPSVGCLGGGGGGAYDA